VKADTIDRPRVIGNWQWAMGKGELCGSLFEIETAF